MKVLETKTLPSPQYADIPRFWLNFSKNWFDVAENFKEAAARAIDILTNFSRFHFSFFNFLSLYCFIIQEAESETEQIE